MGIFISGVLARPPLAALQSHARLSRKPMTSCRVPLISNHTQDEKIKPNAAAAASLYVQLSVVINPNKPKEFLHQLLNNHKEKITRFEEPSASLFY